MTNFLLFIAYYLTGFFMALAVCFGIGLALCVLIALLKSFSRPKNLILAGGYLLMFTISAGFLWFLVFLAGSIGDHTGYVSQRGVICGMIFPGIFALQAIPQCLAVANKQTSGIVVE